MFKRIILGSSFAAFLFFLLKVGGFEKHLQAEKNTENSSPLTFHVNARGPLRKVSKLGLDLSRSSVEGTLQYTSNILMNPGFEGKIERTIVIVSDSTQNSFSDEVGLGFPDNYWNEAEFDIRTGKSAGNKGVVKTSLNSGSHGLPQYFTLNPLPRIEVNDVIVLTKIERVKGISNWWVNDLANVEPDPYHTNPESPGSQSLRLTPTKFKPAEIRFYADTVPERSGNMLLINGAWEFSFWAKSQVTEGRLDALFKRKGENKPFFQRTFSLTPEWKHYTVDFNGSDQGPPAPLVLSLSASAANIPVWIDDLSLKPKLEEVFPFRKEVVQVLKMLNPSFLREFPSLGDMFSNRISPIHARQSWVFRRQGGKSQAVFSYSLPDFLLLCEKVKANPWIVVSPTFSDDECDELGSYLKTNAGKNKFSEVILEFGADNWSWLSRPFAIPYSKEYGAVADRCFAHLQKAMGKEVNARFLVNGQYSFADDTLSPIKYAKKADGMSITPYFFNTLNKATPDKIQLETMFSEDSHLMEIINDQLFSMGKSLAVSEINLGTTLGSAKDYERNRIVSGAASGSALAKKVLESLFAGADPVLIQSLGQYDTEDWDIEGFVNLWGIVRDFGPPVRLRPTGLQAVMLNQVIQGDLYSLIVEGPSTLESKSLTLAAFKSKNGWTAAIVSSFHKPLELMIQFPDDGVPLPGFQFILDTADPFATNEDHENVTILKKKAESQERGVKVTILPWGFLVLN